MNLHPKSFVYGLLALLIASAVVLNGCDGDGGETLEEPAVEEPAVEEPTATPAE